MLMSGVMDDALLEYCKYINKLDKSDIDNPYSVFGYSLIYEESDCCLYGYRCINNVHIVTTDDMFYMWCERKSLVTFVDIMWYVNNATCFENSLSMSKDRVDLLSHLHEKGLRCSVSFKSGSVYDYIEIQHTLIYIVCGNYNDNHYKNAMIKTRKNSL